MPSDKLYWGKSSKKSRKRKVCTQETDSFTHDDDDGDDVEPEMRLVSFKAMMLTHPLDKTMMMMMITLQENVVSSNDNDCLLQWWLQNETWKSNLKTSTLVFLIHRKKKKKKDRLFAGLCSSLFSVLSSDPSSGKSMEVESERKAFPTVFLFSSWVSSTLMTLFLLVIVVQEERRERLNPCYNFCCCWS